MSEFIKAGETAPIDAKEFHIADILNVTTGMLFSPDIIALYDIIDHLDVEENADGYDDTDLSGNMFAEEAEEINKQLPWTKGITFPEVSRDASDLEVGKAMEAFLIDAAATFGEYHSLVPQAKVSQAGPDAGVEYLQTSNPKAKDGKSNIPSSDI